VSEGRVSLAAYDARALPQADVDTGGVLLCRGTPEADVVIDLPYERSRVLSGAIPVRQVVLEALDRWPGDIVRIVVRAVEDPEWGTSIQFDAGQFAQLTPPDGDKSRAYSYASVANWDGTAEFYIKLREGGYFSEYLRDRAVIGDPLTLRGPQGTFGLHENGLRPRWFVCGGTGLAPIMSMLRRMAEWGDPQEALLILGVNRTSEVYATYALAELRATMPRLRPLVTVVEPDRTWDGPVGTAVDQMIIELDARPQEGEPPDIYLCGPPGFLDAARASAAARGVGADQVYEERILGS